MTSAMEKADELVGAIQESKEYKEYSELRRFILQESGMAARVDAFRRKLFFLQNSTTEKQDEFRELQKEYADILADSRAMEFFAAEQAFVQMMRDIYAKIGNAAVMDLSFLNGVEDLSL